MAASRHATLNEGVSIASRQMIACEGRGWRGLGQLPSSSKAFEINYTKENSCREGASKMVREQMLPVIGEEFGDENVFQEEKK